MKMIQPVSAFSHRATFRGSNGTYKDGRNNTDTQVAIINATGVAIATGGLMTAIARSHTPSWGSAAAVGLFGAVLAWFFMTPQLVCKKIFKNVNEKPIIAEAKNTLPKGEAGFCSSMHHIKPPKKIVPFKQS
ncbi:MAG: DUF5353 domain-containing protein [bacterium]|nr:DUF5353 domain-containing protein [bacterium]